jgi:hypothetical protein
MYSASPASSTTSSADALDSVAMPSGVVQSTPECRADGPLMSIASLLHSDGREMM